MRLETITLADILSFRGRTQIDLRNVPPGLVAIMGKNGRGKTTLMEAFAASSYGVFPTRDKKEPFDYALTELGEVTTTFALDGRGVFQAKRLLDGVKRKQAAVLSEQAPDGDWMPLNSDGNIRTFDAAIAKLLPPLPTLLASVFAAQDRSGGFARLDKKSRKELFAELLGLRHYAEMAERAQAFEQRVVTEIGKVQAQAALIRIDCTDEKLAELNERAQILQAEMGTAQLRRRELEGLIADAQARVERFVSAAALFVDAQRELETAKVQIEHYSEAAGAINVRLYRQLDAGNAALLRLATERDRDLADIDERIASIAAFTADVEAAKKKRAAQLRDLQERITGNQAILNAGDDIRQAAERIMVIDRESADREKQLEEIDGSIKEAVEAHRDAQTDDDQRRLIAAEVDRLTRETGLLVDVPCHGEGEFADCRLLTNAQAAKARATELRAQLAIATYVDTEALVDARAAVYNDLIAQRTELWRARKAAHRERDELSAKAIQITQLNIAAERITELWRLVAANQADYECNVAHANSRERDRRDALSEQRGLRATRYETDAAQLRDANTEARAAIERERDEMLKKRTEADAAAEKWLPIVGQHIEAKQEHDKAAGYAASLRDELGTVDVALARLAERKAALDADAQRFHRRKVELAALERRMAALSGDAAEWAVLRKACGRDGLPIIEIDNAGPTVASLTNQLLDGAGFAIELITQEARASKAKDGNTMKDAFDVKVLDLVRGGKPRDLTDLSGGQQVIVDEALKSAIALFMNRRTAHPWQTCWRDETAGALDPEARVYYPQMLRRVYEIGGFHHLFFVTHDTDIAVFADAQIHVTDQGVRIVEPPYDQQEAA